MRESDGQQAAVGTCVAILNCAQTTRLHLQQHVWCLYVKHLHAYVTDNTQQITHTVHSSFLTAWVLKLSFINALPLICALKNNIIIGFSYDHFNYFMWRAWIRLQKSSCYRHQIKKIEWQCQLISQLTNTAFLAAQMICEPSADQVLHFTMALTSSSLSGKKLLTSIDFHSFADDTSNSCQIQDKSARNAQDDPAVWAFLWSI